MPDSNGYGLRGGAAECLFAPGVARAPEAGWLSARNPLFNRYLLLFFRFFLASVFIYAAVQKIGKPLAFADEIRMYGILDVGPLLYIMAIVLPWIELICGISLVTGIFLRGSALALLLLNAMFLIAVSIRTVGIMRSDGISFGAVYYDCGCGFGATYAWKKLLEDSCFFLFSLVLFLAPVYRYVLAPIRRKR
jgi:uncharacterized membrane protein YphA (DoxX/SURF4 family)